MPRIPNRSEDLARPRERKGGNVQPITKGEALPVTVPEPDPDWHHVALLLWQGCQTSGQAEYYQNSDWSLLYSLCDDLSHYKRAGRRSAQMAQAIYTALGRLLVTETDRRRAQVELGTEPPPDDTADVIMDEYRRGLSLVR